MIVLGLAVHVRGRHPVVNRIEITLFAPAIDKGIMSDPNTVWTRFFGTYYLRIVTSPETEILGGLLP